MKKAFHYVPESPELLADRRWEEETSWQTVREAESDKADLMKDYCRTCGFIHLTDSAYRSERIGVPESYSHLYDAPGEVAA